MYHTAAQNLNPALSLTETATLSLTLKAGHIHLSGRLCKGEVVGTKLGLGICSKKLLGKLLQSSL